IRRNHRRKTGGETAEAAFVRVAPGRVDQRNLDPGATVIEFTQHGFEADAIAPDVRLGPDLGVDRNHEALAVGLNAKAAEKDQRHIARLDVAIEPLARLS